MEKLVWFGFLAPLIWLTGCGGTYHSIEVSYPPVSQEYSKLALEINSPKGIDQKELENFRELIILQLGERGFVIVPDAERQLLVKVVKFNKESEALKAARKRKTLIEGGPWTQYTSNALVVRLFLKEQEKTTEFGEFQEYKENTKEWEDMKRLVARRITDAVYFAVR